MPSHTAYIFVLFLAVGMCSAVLDKSLVLWFIKLSLNYLVECFSLIVAGIMATNTSIEDKKNII